VLIWEVDLVKILRDTFKALSDETRLQIMTLLLDEEELCVCDFVGALGQTQSKVSRHLRYLYNAGLLEDRRDGLWMHYRISTKLGPEQAKIVAALSETVGDEQKEALRAALERWFAQKEAIGECQAPLATPRG
jgi:ArsR family transcriptional regulator